MEESVFLSQGFRFSVTREGREVGHAYLYLIRNDFHPSPFGLLEDVFVDHYCRGQGIATELVSAVLAKARSLGCYKLLATSRTDGTRDSVHAWYKRMGFADYGTEFRINL
jgi:GNAT superfamily N-acetyltransferase